jgi:hypothetical protein
VAPAYKEWAVVVHALLAGEQVVDVRKGGLHEAGRHFGLHATRFWLYPTGEHQRAELLAAPYRHWIDLSPAAPVGEPVRIDGWADVDHAAAITEPEQLDALAYKLVWTPDYAQARLRWKRRDPLWVLVLRAHRLLEPVTVPWNDAYGGCTSWVELDGLPDDPASLPSEPALSDVAYRARAQGVLDALPALRAPV